MFGHIHGVSQSFDHYHPDPSAGPSFAKHLYCSLATHLAMGTSILS